MITKKFKQTHQNKQKEQLFLTFSTGRQKNNSLELDNKLEIAVSCRGLGTERFGIVFRTSHFQKNMYRNPALYQHT